MKFRKDNKIGYGQDHHYHKGIPSDVNFLVRESSNAFILRGNGYGNFCGKNNYGNGALYVRKSMLTKKQHDRIKSHSYMKPEGLL